MSYLLQQLSKILRIHGDGVAIKFSDSYDNSTKWLHITVDQFTRIERILLEEELNKHREETVKQIKRSLYKIGG